MAKRDEGSSFTGKYDLRTKTARPESVGPHDFKTDQEDPSNPGTKPAEGYKNEIAEVNAAATRAGMGAGSRAPQTSKVTKEDK